MRRTTMIAQRENLVVAKNRKSNIYLRPKTREKYLVRGGIKKKEVKEEKEEVEEVEGGSTCLQFCCCGFPSVFVPGFLQMEGRVRLQGLSSQRPSCTRSRHAHTRGEREKTQLFSTHTLTLGWLAVFLGGWGVGGSDTYGSPDGDAVLQGVAEVVGFKRVPVGEEDGRVVGPLEVHLHLGVVQADPELIHVWQADRKSRGHQAGLIRESLV